jgi:hypothetical protein
MTTRYRTASVPTNTLKVDDLIIAHGGLFRVREVKVSQSHDASGPGGDCHVNYCEFLGNAHPGYECQIPKHWRDGSEDRGNPGRYNYWNQQGNGLARTCKVVAVVNELPFTGAHAYEAEVEGQGNAMHTVLVGAHNRTSAASRIRKAGYEVRSMNMVG